MQQKDYDKRTALHLASSEGHFECVKYLVENCKVVPTARDRYLNDLFTEPFVNIFCRWGFTPLVEAHRFHHEQVIQYLTHCLQNMPEELEVTKYF